MKAIYKGECQICGRVQKLPKNLLAQHGYSVDWNMFQGVCSGSKELPYEKSCELIKTILPHVKKQLNHLEEKKIMLMKPATSNKCFDLIWIRCGKNASYQWVEGELIKEERSNVQNTYHWNEIYISYKYMNILNKNKVQTESDNLLDVATKLNRRYVENKLNSTIEEIRRYHTWLTKKIDNWKLKELELI